MDPLLSPSAVSRPAARQAHKLQCSAAGLGGEALEGRLERNTTQQAVNTTISYPKACTAYPSAPFAPEGICAGRRLPQARQLLPQLLQVAAGLPRRRKVQEQCRCSGGGWLPAVPRLPEFCI